jgi:hypothetical protein
MSGAGFPGTEPPLGSFQPIGAGGSIVSQIGFGAVDVLGVDWEVEFSKSKESSRSGSAHTNAARRPCSADEGRRGARFPHPPRRSGSEGDDAAEFGWASRVDAFAVPEEALSPQGAVGSPRKASRRSRPPLAGATVGSQPSPPPPLLLPPNPTVAPARYPERESPPPSPPRKAAATSPAGGLASLSWADGSGLASTSAAAAAAVAAAAAAPKPLSPPLPHALSALPSPRRPKPSLRKGRDSPDSNDASPPGASLSSSFSRTLGESPSSGSLLSQPPAVHEGAGSLVFSSLGSKM